MEYQINKNAYNFLCHIGGSSYYYRMDPRNINYYIYIYNYEENRWLKLIIGMPNIPQSIDELQVLLSNVRNIRYNGSLEYSTGLLYWQYNCDIVNLDFAYTVKHINDDEYEKRYEPYKQSKWLYVDYVLIKKFTKEYKNLVEKIDITNEDVLLQNDFYALLPYHTFNPATDSVTPHKIKYYVSIINANIETIYDFNNGHIDELKRMKDAIIKYLRQMHACIDANPQFVRIYTYFPSQNYLGPFFYVDYHDDMSVSYTRIVDDERMLVLDTIIRIIEFNNNMHKYYVVYYTPCDSAIYKFALGQLFITATLFIKTQLESKNVDRLNFVAVHKVMEKILNDPNNYDKIFQFQKMLIGNKRLVYPFITQYTYMTKMCNNSFTSTNEPRQEVNTETRNPRLVISEFKVIQIFYDFTRFKTSAIKTFGMLCEYQSNQYIINFVKRPLFRHPQLCLSTELTLLDDINSTSIGGVFKKENETPYFMEIHKLQCDITNKQNIRQCPPNYNDLLYDHIIHKKYKGVMTKETKEILQTRLDEAVKIPLDNKNMPIFAMLLYKYTDNPILKKIILKYLDDIPEEYIYSETKYPFIVIPDLHLRKKYKENPNFKLSKTNFNVVLWYVDRNIYVNALEVVYDNKSKKTVAEIIESLTPDDKYPFTLGKIGKFIVGDPEVFPHTYRYTNINLLDELYIFINYYKCHMHKLMNNKTKLFDMTKQNKLDFMNDLFFFYFHNAEISNSVVHLHMRIKTMNEKTRHLHKNYVGLENVKVTSLDEVYMYKLIDENYYVGLFDIFYDTS